MSTASERPAASANLSGRQQAIIKNARSVILVADAMKFDRNAPVRIGSVADMDYFICDKQPPDLLMQICHENDVQVRVATQH